MQEDQEMKGKQMFDALQNFFSCLFSAVSCCKVKKVPDKQTRLSFSSIERNSAGSIGSTFSTSEILSGSCKAINFTMAELNKATRNFSVSCRVGQGGFGVVYKGRLQDGTTVAIKRARKDAFQSHLTTQFQSEIHMLAKVEHLNLVRYYGFVEDGNERILVEEFVANGNLRQHLDCEFRVVLDFNMRLDIAIDVAHALTYLHFYADQPIIHRDVKASNILLTETFRAKVADFGFSRIGPIDSGATHVSTQIKGTAGYLDPEYLKTYKLTPKSDVYAFGILLVELLTGRRPIEQTRRLEERITVRWAYNKFLDRNIISILDPKIKKTRATCHVVENIFGLAFQCSAPTKHDRPSIKQAAEYLWSIRKEYQTLYQVDQPQRNK